MTNRSSAPIQTGGRKRTVFRLLAIALGLFPLLLLELGLRLAGLGKPTEYNDPFVGFSAIHPLFIYQAETDRYEIPKSRQTHFRPDGFAGKKGERATRVFVLGGSTVQGRPWAIETSFPTWLELGLEVADPTRDWEVVNCGGISYASYRLVPILEEVLQYQPDLILVMTGHNEFLEDRSYDHIKSAPKFLAWPMRQVSRLRTYNLLRGIYLDATGAPSTEERPELPAESDAILDWEGGMAKYHRDPKWQAGVIAHYRHNLERMVVLAEQANVPLWLLNPVSNLEWPPFKAVHGQAITPAAEQVFADLLAEARQHYRNDLGEALRLLYEARDLDDQHALVHYEIGMCLRTLRHLPRAEQALRQAKDQDVCPLRVLDTMQALLLDVATTYNNPWIDVEGLIAQQSRHGYPSNQWLVDHVHPSIEGHQQIAQHLLDRLQEKGWVIPQAGWELERDRRWQAHLESLPPLYFAQGRNRLKAVQAWAHGQTDRNKP